MSEPMGGPPGVGVWARLEERFGLVSLRPRLTEDVRVRRIGDEYELVQISTRKVLSIGADDAAVVERFDGTSTVAEIILGNLGSAGRLAVEPVLSLVDRLVRAEMLQHYPPDFYRQLINHIARRTVEQQELMREQAGGSPDREKFAHEQVQWRPRTPALAERARFLRNVSLFASLDMWAIGALAEAVHQETYPAASDIVREGELADRFYVVRSGEVNVARMEEDGSRHRIARLMAGEWFGEAGLVEGAPRNATVRAGTSRPVQLYSFDAKTFEHIISPHVTSSRGRQLVNRRRAQLEKVPIFQALASEDLDRLSRVLREVRAPKGTVLFRQGDEGDRFYVIIEGAVGVVKDGTPIAKLGADEFFGETALLFTEGRTATVATTEDCRFWTLDRDAFTKFLRDALLHRRDLLPMVMGRLSSSDPM